MNNLRFEKKFNDYLITYQNHERYENMVTTDLLVQISKKYGIYLHSQADKNIIKEQSILFDTPLQIELILNIIYMIKAEKIATCTIMETHKILFKCTDYEYKQIEILKILLSELLDNELRMTVIDFINTNEVGPEKTHTLLEGDNNAFPIA